MASWERRIASPNKTTQQRAIATKEVRRRRRSTTSSSSSRGGRKKRKENKKDSSQRATIITRGRRLRRIHQIRDGSTSFPRAARSASAALRKQERQMADRRFHQKLREKSRPEWQHCVVRDCSSISQRRNRIKGEAKFSYIQSDWLGCYKHDEATSRQGRARNLVNRITAQ